MTLLPGCVPEQSVFVLYSVLHAFQTLLAFQRLSPLCSLPVWKDLLVFLKVALFKKSQQTCHEKCQQDLNNIKDPHSLFSACLYHPNKTFIYSCPPQLTTKVEKMSEDQFYSKLWWLSVLPVLALSDSWHLYSIYFADWHKIYWQRAPHRKQGG